MYEPGTTLKLKKQVDPDKETGEIYAYNLIRFIQVSPVSVADAEGWTGADAEFCVCVPIANFGGNINRPFGQLRELYEIDTLPPSPGEEAEAPLKTIDEQKAERAAKMLAKVERERTPEEVFALEAPGVAPKPGQKRGRTPQTLPDVKAPSRRDPLAKATAK